MHTACIKIAISKCENFSRKYNFYSTLKQWKRYMYVTYSMYSRNPVIKQSIGRHAAWVTHIRKLSKLKFIIDVDDRCRDKSKTKWYLYKLWWCELVIQLCFVTNIVNKSSKHWLRQAFKGWCCKQNRSNQL